MVRPMTAQATSPPRRHVPAAWIAYGALLLVGGVIDALCEIRPAHLPAWMPWEFSWPVYLATALTLAWFLRGLAGLPRSERPPLWRTVSFLLGILSFYVVLQTRFDYLAQHMFFFHRLAHFVLHHLGAMLIAAGMAGPVLRAGMPDFVRKIVDWRIGRRVVDVIQHPAIAPVQFIGFLYLWLIPQIHTRVMLDRDLYDLMNWSMGVSGILFWALILDPRPSPPARLSFLLRFLLVLAIELPQMVVGAILSLSSTDYYPVYRICGRILDMTALNDQHYGGLIIWLPGTLLSFVAVIAILMALRVHEEEMEIVRTSN
jgi:putative membrane protein